MLATRHPTPDEHKMNRSTTRQRSSFQRLLLALALSSFAACAQTEEPPAETPPNETGETNELDPRCLPTHPEFPPAVLPSGTTARACLEDVDCTDVYVVAHRGDRQHGAPENSLQGMRDAAADGVPFVEVDLRTTADGVVVNMHDGNLQRTVGVDINVSDVTWDELKDYTLKSEEGVEYSIPTFDEILTLAKELDLALYLDIKDVRPDLLADTLEAHNAFDIALARAGTYEQLIALHDADDRFWIMYSVESLEQLQAGKDVVPSVMLAEISLDRPVSLIREIRDAGFHVQQDVMGTGDLSWVFRGSTEMWLNTLDAGLQVPQSDQPGSLVSIVCDRMLRGE